MRNSSAKNEAFLDGLGWSGVEWSGLGRDEKEGVNRCDSGIMELNEGRLSVVRFGSWWMRIYQNHLEQI